MSVNCLPINSMLNHFSVVGLVILIPSAAGDGHKTRELV